jgi:hypothetical protein
LSRAPAGEAWPGRWRASIEQLPTVKDREPPRLVTNPLRYVDGFILEVDPDLLVIEVDESVIRGSRVRIVVGRPT